MLVRCARCLGQKKVMGMGYIEGECKVCEGTGYTMVDKAIEEAPKRRRKAKDAVESENKDKEDGLALAESNQKREVDAGEEISTDTEERACQNDAEGRETYKHWA